MAAKHEWIFWVGGEAILNKAVMPKWNVFALTDKYVNKLLTEIVDLYNFKCLGVLSSEFEKVAATVSTTECFIFLSVWVDKGIVVSRVSMTTQSKF